MLLWIIEKIYLQNCSNNHLYDLVTPGTMTLLIHESTGAFHLSHCFANSPLYILRVQLPSTIPVYSFPVDLTPWISSTMSSFLVLLASPIDTTPDESEGYKNNRCMQSSCKICVVSKSVVIAVLVKLQSMELM